ncbi:MAG: type II toxin-antitoxin system HicB family antitoxin [Planctomycetaceae bacterium]|nr:MAG: type II toxin-antitoxin system HicB family antitoxin [Planctomycetaceae bacterium]
MKIRIEIKTNETGGYTATCPSLPGCICRGQSRDEVKEKINEAICGYIASVGDFVPEKRELIEV